MADDDLRELASGFRKRTLVTARLAGKVGLAMAKRTLRGKDDAVCPNEVDAERAKDAARALVREIGALKGLVMKVGQMASYLPGALPPEAQKVLSELQAESVAMTWSRVADVIREDLGAPPESLFDDFEETPFAAASIGQVHRARLGGKSVAVKVQYPGIESVLESDLETFGFITKVSTFGLPMDSGALVDELRSRILEECDYEREARNQRELGALFESDPDVHVPRVFTAQSSRRVLTSEYVDGARFSRFVEDASRAAKDRAGEIIFRTCWSSLFKHGVFNGDPHPGNYLFSEDGRVTFLDFGCVRRFDEMFIENWKAFARGVLDDDRKNFPARFRSLGLLGKEKGFDYDHQWEITRYLYLPFTQREPFFTYTDDYVRKSYGLILFENPNQRKTAFPPEWLLLNRLQWGVNAVLAKLEATAPWPDHFSFAASSPFERADERFVTDRVVVDPPHPSISTDDART
jgi:predicted unusual protein kinase regulating ubiquinone biosynthesis (AarF/ABC1/UbiB family)